MSDKNKKNLPENSENKIQETRKKILVVDDDPDCVEQVSMVLESRGYEVVRAHSQAEAEEILLSLHPDIAICDLMMEEKDSGFVLCHTIKKLYPDTPVILLTSVTALTGISFKVTDPSSKSWVGADSILDKPVRPEELLKAVTTLLTASRASQK